jgi:hypothetical protein
VLAIPPRLVVELLLAIRNSRSTLARSRAARQLSLVRDAIRLRIEHELLREGAGQEKRTCARRLYAPALGSAGKPSADSEKPR